MMEHRAKREKAHAIERENVDRELRWSAKRATVIFDVASQML